jgi:hypothetical protein
LSRVPDHVKKDIISLFDEKERKRLALIMNEGERRQGERDVKVIIGRRNN